MEALGKLHMTVTRAYKVIYKIIIFFDQQLEIFFFEHYPGNAEVLFLVI